MKPVRQVVVSCVNTDFWLDKTTPYTELRHLLQNKFALDWENAQNAQILLQGVELLATSRNNFSQSATT